MQVKCELYNDHFQNKKRYNIPPAQLILTDIPYNLSSDFFASRPDWYVDGDNTKGESENAHSSAFNTDEDFRVPEFVEFTNRYLKKESTKPQSELIAQKKEPGCIIVFCAYNQQFELIQEFEKKGFKHYIPLVFEKNYSAEVLKANMRIVGAVEYGVLFYRDKLPKFRKPFGKEGKMITNVFQFRKDLKTPRIHTTQKPLPLLKELIETFTDPGDVVLDVCAGSGTTLRAAQETGRNSYGFEIDKKFYDGAKNIMLSRPIQGSLID